MAELCARPIEEFIHSFIVCQEILQSGASERDRAKGLSSLDIVSGVRFWGSAQQNCAPVSESDVRIRVPTWILQGRICDAPVKPDLEYM